MYVFSHFSCVWLFVIGTVACQAPLSMEFSRQEYWRGCHPLFQGIFSIQGSNLSHPSLLHCRWILYRWATREFWLNGSSGNWYWKLQKWEFMLWVARHWVKLLSKITWEADYKPNRFVALEDEVWKQNISSVCWLLLTAPGNALWRRDELRKELAGLQR